MKNKIKYLVIAFVVISSIYLCNTTKSRYLSEVSMMKDVNVAVPQIVLDVTPENKSMLPGDTVTYDFYVRNYDNSNINEILMEYYITLNVLEQQIPLTYKIYEISGTKQTELTKTTKGYGPITLSFENQDEKHFKLVINWDENDNDVINASKNFRFQLGINAEQVI